MKERVGAWCLMVKRQTLTFLGKININDEDECVGCEQGGVSADFTLIQATVAS